MALFGVGAVTSVISQVVHITFNYLVRNSLPLQISQLLISPLFIASQKGPALADDDLDPLPSVGLTEPIQIEPTKEKLDQSRYV